MKNGFSRKLVSLALLLAFFVGAAVFGSFNAARAGDGDVKNVILLIGDGMGYAHVTAARLAQAKKLNMDVIKTTGVMTTDSANSVVTDSAAAGTAMATGYKTNNGMISVTPDGKILKTILEAAREEGKATGLVSTTRITHATPAVFAAHVLDRDDEITIAGQMLKTNVDVLLGDLQKILLEVDATFGTSWKIGDYIQMGQVLGKAPGDNKMLVTAPGSGIIQAIVFDADTHVLEIQMLIKEKD